MEEKKPRANPGDASRFGDRNKAKVSQAARTPEGLTIAQEAYARARAMGMSMHEAATAVNLHTVTVRKWEKEEPWVADRIAQLSAIATNNAIIKTGLNREWVITRLMSVVDRCMQAEQVTNSKGEPTGEYKFDASGANQALRMLGDTMGLFKPAEKKEDDYANLTDADLARIAQELASQVGLLEAPAGNQTTAGSGQVIEVQALPQAG
jgi:phage terminase small subunit